MDKIKKEQPEVEPQAEKAQVPPVEETESQEQSPAQETETPELAEAEATADAAEQPSEEPQVDEAAEKLQQMGEKLAEMQDKYTRLYAEFENYRRHTKLQIIDLQLNGHKEMVKTILPVIDDFERALASMADDDPSKEGVKLIYDKMLSILQQKGVKQMKAAGEAFDADLHEAVAQIPAQEGTAKNTVIDEVQKGYYLNDKVLRHAKVVVAV